VVKAKALVQQFKWGSIINY